MARHVVALDYDMQCVKPFRVTKNLDRSLYPDGLEVPCGKCLPCRIKKRQEWAVRLLHELDNHEDSIFLTLTYDNEKLPFNTNYPTLRKRDIQLFIKRLRKDLQKVNKNIKYFFCGEYGSQTERPHYHAIIYGLSLKPEDKKYIMENWPYCDWNNKQIKTKSFGVAENDSILYVAKYINKVFSGEKADTEYNDKDREPVFRLLSQGMGKNFAEKNKKQILENGYVSVKGVKQSIPRYYLKKIEITNPEELKKLKEKLKQEAEYKQAELVEAFTGLNTTEDILYRTQKVEDVVEYYEKKKRSKIQNSRNCQASIDIKNAKLKKV